MPLILDYFIGNTTWNRGKIHIGCQVNRNKHGEFVGIKEESLIVRVPLSAEEAALYWYLLNW